ncbi:MAG: trypsin-like peptidase domain-containing protein, partial [Anaerolineales bacterium]
MQSYFQKGIIRFYNKDQVCGVGFLVSGRCALTCAHVINAALGKSENSAVKPTESVEVDFPFSNDKRRLQAKVVSWKPPQPDMSGDIAGLELDGEIPRDVIYPPLYKLNDLWDHRFRAYGFPQSLEAIGPTTTGRVLSRTANGWFQVEGNQQAGYFIQPGFSGAPIWDEELSGVIGIAVAADLDPAVKTAFIIPVSSLVDAWPDLDQFAKIPGLKFNQGLQDFLQTKFSDAELLQFCAENYTSVLDNFTIEMSLANKVERLMDYCERTHSMDGLVEQIKTRFPESYRNFIASFCSTSLGIS